MRNSTAIQESGNCIYNLAKLTNNNKMVVEQFIICNSNLKITRPIKMFKIVCNVTKNTKKTNCPTFLKVRESSIQCLKVCWNFPFDYITICNQKPKSNVLRNCMILLFSLLIVVIGICIGKNWYAIKVGFY